MRVALYPRVSTQEQAQEGYSIQEQIDRMMKYCDAMGWSVYNTYTDAGFSGASVERPGLQKMIRDVKAGKIDKVLVYKLDRLSRSQKDTLLLIEDVFLANNTEFVSMSENFDTSTPFGRAIVGILAVFAQLEREQIKERMSMGRFARAKEGKFHGGSRVPIGYEYIDGELVTNEFEKLQIIKAFEMFVSGKSPYKIASELNENGMIHKYGKWHNKSIRRILKQQTYIGLMPYGDEWYEGNQERFISDDLFNAAQKMLEQRSEEHKAHNRRLGAATSYLSGYLTCSCCGGKYAKRKSRKKLKDGTPYERNYYVCYSRIKCSKALIKDPNCKNKNWPMEELDGIIFDEIRKLALDPEYFNQITEEKQDDNSMEVIKAEITKLDNQMSRLMDLYSLGTMPLDQLQDKIHELNDKKTKLEQEIDAIILEQADDLSKEKTLKIINSFGEILERGDYDEIRGVIGSLIDRIDIDHENIDIHWTFA